MKRTTLPLLGAALLLAGCQDQSLPTGALETPRAAFSTAAAGKVTFRPISDYLDATRGGCEFSWFNGDLAPADRIRAFVDLTSTYTPAAAYTGSVKEQEDRDGTRTLTVQLRGTDVAAWARNASNQLVFDSPIADQVHFRFTFSLAAGAALPDLCGMLATVSHEELQFSGRGSLRAASGYPDGTPGMLTVVQTGRHGLPPQKRGLEKGVGDRYPAELVMVRPLAR